MREKKAVPLGYYRTTILMSSQQLWLLAQDQASQHSSMECQESHEHLLLIEELLTADGFWERESWFALRVWPPAG